MTAGNLQHAQSIAIEVMHVLVESSEQACSTPSVQQVIQSSCIYGAS